jgi:DNA-directed RNA polymerase specialized sigma subunit
MYQIKPKPPDMHLNDYIVRYKQSGDEQYLRHFLHCYEPRLNTRAENFCLQQGYLHHFQDIKQAMLEAVLEKISDYNPDTGASLLTYAHRHIEAAAHEYVRQNCGTVSPSEYDYDNLRTIMAIFNSMPEATETEKIQAAIEKTGLSEKQVYQHLQNSETFRNPMDIDSGSRNEDDGFLPLAEKIGDVSGNPETILLKRLLYEALIVEVDALPYKEYHLLLDYCGLKRYEDWFIDLNKPLAWEILAARLHVGTQEAVNENFRNAAAIVRKKLEEAHWFEGKHTPEFISKIFDAKPDLTHIDCDVIEYAKRKWHKSGTTADFYMLFRNGCLKDGNFILQFLKLWIY